MPFDEAQDRPFDEARGGEECRWVREALAGDGEAFARLVESYQISVYNLAYRMLGNAEDAEDAAQETFLRAYSRLRSYDPARKFSSWLLAIAAHHCIDRLRRRTISLEDTPLGRWFSTSRDPEREVERKEEREEIHRLLERLPPHYRLVVILYYWNDLSCREVGEVMGLGEGAVKSRLHRARRMLAQTLREERESASHHSSVAIREMP